MRRDSSECANLTQVDERADKRMQKNSEASIFYGSFDCVLGAWRVHESELKRFLKRRMRDPDTAEDLLHEIFLKAMESGQGFCRLDNPRAWLFRVARNAAIDFERRQHDTVTAEELASPQTESDPVETLERCLAYNLSQLRSEEQDIIRHCDLEGLQQAEFANARGLSLSAAKARLLRARQRLRTLLVRNCRVRFDEHGRVCCHVGEDDAVAPATDPSLC